MKGWRQIGWIRPIIDILMSANSETVDYHLQQIFKATDNEENYIRVEIPVAESSKEMDDASPENISRLQDAAQEYIEANTNLIEIITNKLAEQILVTAKN